MLERGSAQLGLLRTLLSGKPTYTGTAPVCVPSFKDSRCPQGHLPWSGSAGDEMEHPPSPEVFTVLQDGTEPCVPNGCHEDLQTSRAACFLC